jgi:hypothetical protein
MISEALTKLDQPDYTRREVIEPSVSTVLSALRSELLLLSLETLTSDRTRQLWISYRYRDASTQEETPSEELNDQIEKLFKSAREGFYEDSFFEDFSTKLTYFVRRCGDETIVALAPFVIGETANAEVAAETVVRATQVPPDSGVLSLTAQ